MPIDPKDIEVKGPKEPELTVLLDGAEETDPAAASKASPAPLSREDKTVSESDVADLARELAAAKAEAKASKTETATARAETAKARTSLSSQVEARFAAEEEAISQGTASAESQIERLIAEQAAAFEAGEWKKAGELGAEMAEAKVMAREFSFRKGQLDSAKEQMKSRAEAAAKAPAAQPGIPARTQAWIDAHPKFTTDAVYNAKAMLAHTEALAEGHAVESDEYFGFINKALGEGTKAVSEKTKAAPEADPEADLAPVSRRTTEVTRNRDPKVIRLSADEAEFAELSFPDLSKEEAYKTYAQNKLKLQNEGRLARN